MDKPKTFNIMEKFKNFEIENQEMIFGGELVETVYTTNELAGKDKYDTVRDAVVYLPGEPTN